MGGRRGRIRTPVSRQMKRKKQMKPKIGTGGRKGWGPTKKARRG